MRTRLSLLYLLPAALWSAQDSVLIRTTDGTSIEGQTLLKLPKRTLSVHSAAPASAFESGRIQAGLAAIQGNDRKARDLAVEELTAIGLPVMTPLLKTLKDTDQHEPRPLYRLFERIIPSDADGFDRTLSLIRVAGGEPLRVKLPEGQINLTKPGGETVSVPWSKIRTLAIRQKVVTRVMAVHSLRHSTQIEYMDTGVVLTQGSKLDTAARGFTRLSWDTDSWASGPDGLTKPGSPAYKSHLFEGHPFGALVGRVTASGQVFFLGKQFSKAALGAGRLGVAINDNPHWQNNLGTFTVTLTATDGYDLGAAQ
jgi:hypothetical protein